MDFIRFESINLKFADKVIFENFSLSIKRGEKIVISGKSGTGKSTLFKLLMGFERPDSGQIYIDQQQIQTANMYEIRKNFAYVNQDVTLRKGTASAVLKDIAKFSGNDFTGEIRRELSSFFEFDTALLDKSIEKLSGGERQRLGLMIALSLNRPVLLLDEVTSALDNDLKQKVVDRMSKSNKTIISISHDQIWQKNDIFRKVDW